jgi:hypothetical protein
MTGSLSGDLVFTDPYLPPELEHQIFEIAALSHPKDIPTFMRISRRIKYWYLLSQMVRWRVLLKP